MKSVEQNLEDTQIVFLTKEKFIEWRDFITDVHCLIDSDEETCLSVRMDSGYFIVINEDVWNELPDDYKMIILAHETAHLEGIKDEEDADLEAMKYLNLEQIEILTDMWEERHGKKYKK